MSGHLDLVKKLVRDAQRATADAGLYSTAMGLTAALAALSRHEQALQTGGVRGQADETAVDSDDGPPTSRLRKR